MVLKPIIFVSSSLCGDSKIKSTQSRTGVKRVGICQASGHRMHRGQVQCPVLCVRAARLLMVCRTESSHRFQRLWQYMLLECLRSGQHAVLAPDHRRKSCRDTTRVGRTERSVGTKFSDLALPCSSEGAWLRSCARSCHFFQQLVCSENKRVSRSCCDVE